jgi:uncharacterized GH25 family protein
MTRSLLAAWAVAVVAAAAPAHFVFVVPDAKAPAKLTVVFSEDLEVDENVPADRLKGLALTGRFAGGKTAPVELKPGKSCLTGELGLVEPQAAYGTLVLGVMEPKKAGTAAYLLAYHPKAVLAGCDPALAAVGKAAPVELVPVVAGGEVRFKLLAGDAPVADAEVTVLTPDGGKKKAKTDAAGLTPGYPANGRYGAWAKHVVAGPGEHGGKKYSEARHYATLVADLPAK